MNKNIILAIAVVIVFGAIGYLEITKPKSPKSNTNQVQPIALTTPTDSVKDSTDSTSGAKSSSSETIQNRAMIIKEKVKKYPSAVEIIPGGQFINSDPFTLKSLIGKKVILVDFWTYTCINCQRTTPYLNAWYAKYKDQGFVIVGVHSPEFEFEKDYNNVLKAVQDAGIKYPVVQDNNFATWYAYGNRFWPHKYLIDIDGYIVYDHIGEGAYDKTEKIIQDVLKERSSILQLKYSTDNTTTNPSDAIPMDRSKVESSETYFGSQRNEYLANGVKFTNGVQTLSIPNTIQKNVLYLGGKWNFNPQFAESVENSSIVYKYVAKNVYLVASSINGVKIKIFLDGKILDSKLNKDIAPDGTILIKENKLYNIVNGLDYSEHLLRIEVESPGLDAYTFTFG